MATSRVRVLVMMLYYWWAVVCENIRKISFVKKGGGIPMRLKLCITTLVASLVVSIACTGTESSATNKEKTANPGSQGSRESKIITLNVLSAPSDSKSKWDGVVVLDVDIESEYHINSNTPSTEFLIPTAVKFKANPSVMMGPAQYPKGIDKKFSFSEDKLSIYEGRTTVRIPYKATLNTVGEVLLEGVFSYQACTDLACLPPRGENFELKLSIGS